MNTTNQNKNNHKKILIPLDFTPQSEVGLKTGLSIAVKTGADLSLFHAIDEPEAQGFRTDASYVAKISRW